MRVGPEIKRGAGWMREGAFDFLALFGSFWGDAKKNKTLEVKLRFNLASGLRSELFVLQPNLCLLFHHLPFPAVGSTEKRDSDKAPNFQGIGIHQFHFTIVIAAVFRVVNLPVHPFIFSFVNKVTQVLQPQQRILPLGFV